VSDPDRE